MKLNKKTLALLLLIAAIILCLKIVLVNPRARVIENVIALPEKLEIPDAHWVDIYFTAINEITEGAHWKPLREVGLPHGSLEIRIWIGFGEFGSSGLRLLRNGGGEWTGCYVSGGYFKVQEMSQRQSWPDEHIKAICESYLKEAKPFYELTPKTSWTRLWEKVEALGILTLPDASTLPNERSVLDGIGYIVEINDGERYRAYLYSNPQEQEWAEAERIIKIIKTLREEFQHSLPANTMAWDY